ncbi:MAG: hypothetical protein JKY60_20450 [Kordiimonadaceae bacterium]|nr:hypothetical protein [Kordiimonadaceae bacterium]
MNTSDKIKRPTPSELLEAQRAVIDASKEILSRNKELASNCSRGVTAWRYGRLDRKAAKIFDDQSSSLLFRFCDNSSRREINSIIEKLSSEKPPKQLGDFLTVPKGHQEVELLRDFFESYLGAIEEQDLKVSRSNSKRAVGISIGSLLIAATSLYFSIFD